MAHDRHIRARDQRRPPRPVALGAAFRARFLAFARTAGLALLLAVIASPAAATDDKPPAADLTTPRLKPPPPAPSAVLSRQDYSHIAGITAAIRAGRLAAARAAADDIGDALGRDLALWLYIDAEDPHLDFHLAADFIDRRPDWPSPVKFQRLAERAMPEDLPSAEIFAFFADRAPITGDGKRLYARTLAAAGEMAASVRWARAAWIDHDWSAAEEQALLKEFGAHFRAQDHAARVDRLL